MPTTLRHILTSAFLFCFVADMSAQTSEQEKDVIRLFELFQEYEYSDTIKARIYSDSSLWAAEQTGDMVLMGRANQFKGWYYQDNSNFKRAKVYFSKSLSNFIKTKSMQGIADAYGNLGNICFDMKDYVPSLDYHLKSVHQNDLILSNAPNEEDRGRAQEGKNYALSNIAGIFNDLELYDKALEYERKSLAGEIAAKNTLGEAISYCAIANSHKKINNIDSAEYYFKKGIKIAEDSNYVSQITDALYSYASMKGSNLSIQERGSLLLEALEIDEQLGNRDGIVFGLLGLADYQFKNLSPDSLDALLDRAGELILEYDLSHHLERFNKISSKSSARFGRYRQAYDYLKEYVRLKKIADGQKENREILTAEVKYQVQSKSKQDSLQMVESFDLKREKDQRKIAEQRTWITLGILGGLVLIGSLSFFIYANRRRRRLNDFLSEKNEVINHQKNVVDNKNKSISSSIAYAQRLQSAILPKRTEIEEHFPESFLIFKPKDLVSGDFYWFETFGDKIYIAAADCTGHGVPGAIVSVVCSNALSRVLKEFGITEPSKILSRTRELVMETFGRSDKQVEDGMDISLCAIDKAGKKVVFAGANNPLWIVRSNDHLMEANDADRTLNGASHHLLEYKGDKQPVGPYPEMKDFTDREVDVFQGDILYMFSDGFSDQFGGEADKKFRSGRLKKELLSRSSIELHEQEVLIDNLYENWKGENEQVDDVCMIAVRL
ncbi:MAG: SpoIIE family protein phosphatase [Crocinitomicaceae bacterium]